MPPNLKIKLYHDFPKMSIIVGTAYKQVIAYSLIMRPGFIFDIPVSGTSVAPTDNAKKTSQSPISKLILQYCPTISSGDILKLFFAQSITSSKALRSIATPFGFPVDPEVNRTNITLLHGGYTISLNPFLILLASEYNFSNEKEQRQ